MIVDGYFVKYERKLRHKQNANSVTGTRTRVAWVKARYPNHLDYYGITGYILRSEFFSNLYLEQPLSRRKCSRSDVCFRLLSSPGTARRMNGKISAEDVICV